VFCGLSHSVLLSVRVNFVKLELYRLVINGETVCEVATDYATFGSVRPQLSKTWLRQLVAEAIRRYFARRSLGCETEVVRA
jgi:hypothetical protein